MAHENGLVDLIPVQNNRGHLHGNDLVMHHAQPLNMEQLVDTKIPTRLKSVEGRGITWAVGTFDAVVPGPGLCWKRV